MADGEVLLEVRADSSKIEQDLNEAQHKIDTAVTNAAKSVDKITDAAEDIGKKSSKAIKTAADNIDDLGDNAKDAGNKAEDAADKVDDLSDALDGVSDNADKASNNVDKTGDKFDDMGGKAEKSGGKISSVGGVIVKAGAAIIAAVGAAAAKCIKMSAEAETSFAKVKTLLGDTTDFDKFKGEMTELSKSTGQSFEDISESIYSALSASVDEDKVIGFVDTANKLAKGGFTEASTAVDVLTTAINAYGMAAEDATHISDVLINTQNKGKTTVDELAASMGQTIPVANANKTSLEDLSTQYAVLTKNGLGTAEAGTQIKAMLAELGKSGSKADDALRALTGQGFAQLQEAGANTSDVLFLLQNYAEQAGVSLSDMFGSVEAGNAALTLMKDGGEDFNNILASMSDSLGATEQAFETMEDTTAAKWEKFTNKLAISAEKIGDKLKPVADELLDAVSPMIDEILPKVEEALVPLVEDISGLIEPIMSIVSEVLPDLLELLQPIVELITDVLNAVLPPLLDIIGELIPPLTKIVEKIMPVVAELLEAISPLLELVGELLNPILDIVIQLLDPILDLIEGLTPLIKLVTELLNLILPPLISLIKIIIETIIPALNVAIQSITSAVEIVVTYIETAINTIKGVFEGILDFITGVFSGDWEKAWGGVKKIFDNIWQGILTIAESVVNGIIDVLNSLIDAFNFVIAFTGAQIGHFSKVDFTGKGAAEELAKATETAPTGKEASAAEKAYYAAAYGSSKPGGFNTVKETPKSTEGTLTTNSGFTIDVNALDFSDKSKKKGSGSTKKEKTEQELKEEQYKSELEDLDYALKMDEITEDAYYEALAKLRDKYLTADSKLWRAANVKIHEYEAKKAKNAEKEAKKSSKSSSSSSGKSQTTINITSFIPTIWDTKEEADAKLKKAIGIQLAGQESASADIVTSIESTAANITDQVKSGAAKGKTEAETTLQDVVNAVNELKESNDKIKASLEVEFVANDLSLGRACIEDINEITRIEGKIPLEGVE